MVTVYSKQRNADAIMRRDRNLPPKQYDRPFDGEVFIIRELSQKVLSDNCGTNGSKVVIPSGKWLGGCAPVNGFTFHADLTHSELHRCVILLAEISIFRRNHRSVEDTIRHETGHCNGWPQDHPKD
jgi:hypothetical protein